MPYSIITDGKYQFFLNDLIAARWVRSARDIADEDRLVRKFRGIHELFLRRLHRSRPDLFVGATREFLLATIRGWMRLYEKGLDALRRDHPRTAVSADLECNGTNWSEFFGISYSGLRFLSDCSRYAEFWAERSFRSREVFGSLEARAVFMDSDAHRRFYQLWSEDKLVLLDDFTNGVPSFDFMQQVARHGLGARDAFCHENHWRIVFWSEDVEEAFSTFTAKDWDAATRSQSR